MVTPRARDPVEKMPIAISPFMFLFCEVYIIMKDVNIIIGAAVKIGEVPIAIAKDKAAKPTSESPCPISEYFFKVKITPNNEAQIDTNIPTIMAFMMNG